MGKTLLFIVTEIDSANGVCACAVMQEFLERGYKVFCITNKEYKKPIRYEKDGIFFISVKPRMVYRIYSYMNAVKLTGFKRLFFNLAYVAINKFKLALSIFTWPLISPRYSKRIYLCAKQVIVNEHVDVVIPVNNKIDAVIAANKLKTYYPEILYIPYFLDSLSGGYGPHIFSKEKTIQRGLWWEKRLLTNADKIILMKSSQKHHEHYSSKLPYYEKMVFLDLPLIKNVQINDITCGLLPKDKINLLYIGTIPRHVRDPRYLLKTFQAIEDNNLCLTIIGTSTCQEILEDAAQKDLRIRLLPFVSHEEAIAAMKASDFLVSIGNNNASMTPCKIFEYMSVGKPIISTAPIEDEPSLSYLKYYPITCILDERREVKESAERLSRFIQTNKSKQVSFEMVKKAFPLNTPVIFADVIETTIRDSNK